MRYCHPLQPAQQMLVVPVVPLVFIPLRLHRNLAPNLSNWNDPDLVWDIIHHPDHARLWDRSQYRKWVQPNLDEPAIDPGVNKVWIVSDHPVLAHWINNLWGHMSIKASSKAVTVRDVLVGIYDYLNEPLTRKDMDHAKRTEGNDKRIHAAGFQRSKDSYSIDYLVQKLGCTRADVLGNHRRFQGLHIVEYPNNIFKLHLSLLPGPPSRIP